jgi:predicted nucleotidyltransferase
MGALEFLKTRREHILATAGRHGAGNVRVFGSVLRGAETPESDIDLLVEFAPDRSLLDLVGLQIDLETLLGRRTDVVTEASLSPYLRERILLEAGPL